MANINQNGINFNNYKTTGWELGGNPLRMPIQGPDEDGGIINAVDIDWNGAQVEENVTINSTGDLLSWIKTKGGNGGGTIL